MIKIFLAATLSTISFAPPEVPEYWTQPNQQNVKTLLENCLKADEVSIEDMRLIFTIINKSSILDGFSEYINANIKAEPERRMSWDDVKYEFDKFEKAAKKEFKKQYEQSKDMNPQLPAGRGKDA